MYDTISDLSGDIQLTSILALQIDGYGISGACYALKHIPDPSVFSKVCSVMLSLEGSKWIRSMKPYGNPPDLTTLNLKMRDGTEVCLERHVMTEGGILRSIKSVEQRRVLERVGWLSKLGELGKLFVAEPEGEI